MDPIVKSASELLARGHAFVLATIIRQQGSAPRTSGTRMLITPDQQIFGTIGGGLLEGRAMQAAAKMDARAPVQIMTFDLTNHDAAKMEMICGGRVQVLLDYIPATDENRALFNSWREALSMGRRAMMVSYVPGDGSHIERIAHAVVSDGIAIENDLDLPVRLRKQLAPVLSSTAHVQVLRGEEGLVVVDPGNISPTLYIFGAGHVARPTAHLAAMTGFAVVVLDDRGEFADPVRFPEAEAVHVISGFDKAFENLAVDKDSYIIIITRGHLHDKVVLAQALKTPAAYIGMIGSRRKRDTIYKSLLTEGYTEADIARVHSPIGLTIGADTPEEIGVSIAAELIAVRACVKP
ncbi:MAG: XdhC family protein [Desulfobacteraceae bacterium]